MVIRRRAIGSIVVALLVAGGCSVVGSPEPTVYDEVGMPRWAGITVTADPPVADRDIDLAIVILPEEERLRTTTIPSGTVVRWEEGLSSGPIQVLALDDACNIVVDLPPERSTDVVLTLTSDGCSFRVVGPDGSRPPTSNSGTITADVTVKPWAGLLVEAVSLDTPRQPVPGPVPPDEGGLAIVEPLYPGRYDVSLRRGDVILETQRVTILDRGEAGHLVRLAFDGVPD
jgi:hypothetical protein